MSIWDDIEDIAEDIVDAASDVGSSLGDVASSLFEGPGQLVGIAAAGTALFVVGPGAVLPVFIAGSTTGNLLIRHRHMTDAERRFAESVFGPTLPANDRIVLTNLAGIEGRKFVCPNASGQVLVNLGNAYDNPMDYRDDKYPTPGKVFIHELTHVWQIHHAAFVPGLVCEGIGNQLSGVSYEPGFGGEPWGGYNLEQQATIVDEWFAPCSRSPERFRRSKRPEHPFYRYVCVDVRGEALPRNNAMVTSGQAVARVFDHLDAFWIGPDGAIGSTWWDAARGMSWEKHAPFPITPPRAAQSPGLAVVSRRPDHLDVFWIGPDGSVGSTWWNMAEGASWENHAPFPIAPPKVAGPGAPVAAVARGPEQLDVFWIGPDGAIGSTFWNAAPGMNWGDHAPFPITPPGAAQSAGLAVVSRRPDHLDVFWVGPDGAIGSTWWDAAPGMSWGDHAPFPITPPGAARPGSPVAAVARGPDHMDVFWIGPDGAIGSTWWDAASGMNWGDHAPFPITPPGAAQSAGLAVVSRRPDHLDVFWVGPDGAIGSTFWDAAPGLGWADHAPFPIAPPKAARPGSPVAAVARGPEQLDVFWIGPDGAIGSTFWNAAPGMNWGDHGPFPITPPGAAM
jgi:hypothetical protein